MATTAPGSGPATRRVGRDWSRSSSSRAAGRQAERARGALAGKPEWGPPVSGCPRPLLCRGQPRAAVVIQRVVDRELLLHVVEVVPRHGLKPGRHGIEPRRFRRKAPRLGVGTAYDQGK